jgi:hypothetical protein
MNAFLEFIFSSCTGNLQISNHTRVVNAVQNTHSEAIPRGLTLRQFRELSVAGKGIGSALKSLAFSASERTTMATRKLRMMGVCGDKTLAEWDTESVTPERLAEIEQEFREKVAQGWFAADITDKRNVLIRDFDPQAEILLMPRVQGGC